MNRLEKRHAVFDQNVEIKFPGRRLLTIPEICVDLHGANTGLSDGMPLEEERNVRKFLQCCLETWEPPCFPFDATVKAMIEAVLAEKSIWPELSSNT